ncbi:arginine methyl transferase [Mycena belliarum]|uniref:Arginine methyl transferase n=1 Tax=Mycena belliarum TaxID=1033014 RepID=A0AAD6U4D2_9AGAR|nr:arginine methyl transferase [Mycena belliae]
MSETDEDELDAITVLGEHLINTILLEEPLDIVKAIVAAGAPVWYQNESEGISCLHAAVYIQDLDLVKLLLQEGAVWNAADYLQMTAGDIALSFNNEAIYTIIRDAGIRAELLLSLLSSQTPVSRSDSAMILKTSDDTAAASSQVFLSSELRFVVDEHGQDICMLNIKGGEEIGVMMGWETEIMRETVAKLCLDREPTGSLKILNVGFGLGIIDTLFQSLSPALHVIIEAHPDVLKHMKQLGWYEKPGVKILEGKWQDYIDTEQLASLVSDGGFNLVYTDPFSEDFAALRHFFKSIPALLSPNSRFSFFNGLGGTNNMFYDVSTKIAYIQLANAGFDVEWSVVDVSQQRKQWGKSRPYFTVPTYRLPVCRKK